MADTKLSALATEATPSVGDERLYGVQGLGGSPTSVYHKIGDIMYYGANAPSTPEAGFLWHETGTLKGIVWEYGTYASASRWVSQPFSIGALNTGASGASASNVSSIALNNGYDIYIQTFDGIFHVLTTNNGSNYWTANIRSLTTTTAPATGNGSLLGGLSTAAISAGTWTQVSATIDAVVVSSTHSLMLDLIKTSSPGNMHASGSMTCRLVHP